MKLESNLLLEMLNPTCKSNEEQNNNNSGTKGSTKSKAQKSGSGKDSKKKRPRSGKQKVSISSCAQTEHDCIRLQCTCKWCTFIDCILHTQSPLPQQNPPTKKRKQAAEADNFHIEVGSPAKHSKPPSQVESAAKSEPPRANSEPSTSVTEHSEPSSKTMVDHADISSDSSDSDTDANLYSAVDDALSNVSTCMTGDSKNCM